MVRAGLCSTGTPAWPPGLLPSRGARASRVLAQGHNTSFYPESFSTNRGHVLFLASFISISSMMSQREMICNRKEQKQAWSIRKRLERSGYWCEGSPLWKEQSAAPGVPEAGSDSSKALLLLVLLPAHAGAGRGNLGAEHFWGCSVSWFCCSNFAGDICEKEPLSSPKTIANAYTAIIYFILHVARTIVKTVPNGRSNPFATNPSSPALHNGRIKAQRAAAPPAAAWCTWACYEHLHHVLRHRGVTGGASRLQVRNLAPSTRMEKLSSAATELASW